MKDSFWENEIHKDLFLIIKCFPDHKDKLKTLFFRSKNFQGICQDYHRCHDALFFWSQPDNKSSFKLREEYSALLLELGDEIIQMLDEAP